jgi:hypothetical protein
VGVDVEWWIPIYTEPVPPAPVAFSPAPPAPGEEASPAPADGVTQPAADETAAAADEPAAPAEPEPRMVALAPPEPIPVESRGFWDGDRLVLDAVLVDPATGEVLWRKRVAKSVDPRNVKAVRAVVDELLSEGGWTAAAPAPPGT